MQAPTVLRIKAANRGLHTGDDYVRGAFLIIMLISLLIVGMLVIKNLSTEPVDDVEKIESVQKAREITRESNRRNREKMDRLDQAMPSEP